MKPTQQEIIDLARAVDIVPGIGDVVNGKYRPHKNALGKSVPVEWLQEFAKLLLERFGAGGGEPVMAVEVEGGCWNTTESHNFFGIPDGTYSLYAHPSPTDLRAEYLRGLEDAKAACQHAAYKLGNELMAAHCADAIEALKGK